MHFLFEPAFQHACVQVRRFSSTFLSWCGKTDEFTDLQPIIIGLNWSFNPFRAWLHEASWPGLSQDAGLARFNWPVFTWKKTKRVSSGSTLLQPGLAPKFVYDFKMAAHNQVRKMNIASKMKVLSTLNLLLALMFQLNGLVMMYCLYKKVTYDKILAYYANKRSIARKRLRHNIFRNLRRKKRSVWVHKGRTSAWAKRHNLLSTRLVCDYMRKADPGQPG